MARTPNAIIEKEIEAVRAIVAAHPSGVAANEIATEYSSKHHSSISNRTLLRRIERLIERQEISQIGDARSTLYQSKQPKGAAQTPDPDYVPLSAQGTKLRDLIRRPPSQKKPVAYDADWLFKYKPGDTWYLTKTIRAHLRGIGTTQDESRPAGTFAREILNRLLIDLAWASSRLEGNTYSRLDTQNLIEFGQRAEGKGALEAQMILNHKAAIELLVNEAEYSGRTRATVLALHAALSENLLGDAADEGRVRERAVSIGGTQYIPNAIPQIIRESFDRIVATFDAIPDPFEQAFFAMVHIPYLQPFMDVNKRTSRLLANLPLIRANLCPLSFVEVPEKAYVEGTLAIYELNQVELLRDVFIWAYERSQAQYVVVRSSVPQPDPLRIRYREQLHQAVRATVTSGSPPDREGLRNWAAANRVAGADQEGFAERALALLLGLNEGTLSRYDLSVGDLLAWKQKFDEGSRDTAAKTNLGNQA